MPIISNNNPFMYYTNCQNTYAVFLKLEQDINNNIHVPFYFMPRERENLSFSKEEYMRYVNSTLKTSIRDMLYNYGDNYKVIETFPISYTSTFGYEFKNSSFNLVEINYNSFKTLFLVSANNNQAILLNYFKHDDNYALNESCCIPQLDFNTISQSKYIYTRNGIQYINTYEPYLAFKKKNRNGNEFWTSIENYLNRLKWDECYSFYQIGNLFIIYDYYSKSDLNQGF